MCPAWPHEPTEYRGYRHGESHSLPYCQRLGLLRVGGAVTYAMDPHVSHKSGIRAGDPSCSKISASCRIPAQGPDRSRWFALPPSLGCYSVQEHGSLGRKLYETPEEFAVLPAAAQKI